MADQKDTNDDTKTAQKVINRQTELEKIRDPFVDIWKMSTALGYPARNDWEGTSKTGRDTEVEIYDDTCIKALNIRADGLYGYHVSPAFNWFRGRMADKELQEIDEVRQWRQEADEVMYLAYSRSNFYSEPCIGSFLRDGDGIGLATMFVEEVMGTDKIGFMVPHPREVWLAEDIYGYPNLMHRKFKWTTNQIMRILSDEEIGKLSEAVRINIKADKQIVDKVSAVYLD